MIFIFKYCEKLLLKKSICSDFPWSWNSSFSKKAKFVSFDYVSFESLTLLQGYCVWLVFCSRILVDGLCEKLPSFQKKLLFLVLHLFAITGFNSRKIVAIEKNQLVENRSGHKVPILTVRNLQTVLLILYHLHYRTHFSILQLRFLQWISQLKTLQ